jgi:hypothetical protein
MTVVNGRVSAELTTSNPQAHALLSADLTALRQALEAQGLSVDRLAIQNGPNGGASSAHQQTNTGRPDLQQGTAASAAPSQSSSHSQQQSQQQGTHSDQGSQERGQQQRHDAGHGQSRGRSSEDGQRDGNAGNRSRRRASFANVFAGQHPSLTSAD